MKSMLLRVEHGKQYVWLREMKPQLPPSQQQAEGEGGKESTTEEADEQFVTEEDSGMSDVDPDERETDQKSV